MAIPPQFGGIAIGARRTSGSAPQPRSPNPRLRSDCARDDSVMASTLSLVALGHARLPPHSRRAYSMGMPVVKRRWTVADLADLPDDGNRYEVVDGELLVTPSPTLRHQDAAFELAVLLREYLARERVGHVIVAPAEIVFSPSRGVQPDVLVAPLIDGKRPERLEHIRELLLAVEVLSPTTARADRVTKRVLYRDQRVHDFWIVDLDTRVFERSVPEDPRVEVLDDHITWHPEGATSPLVIDLRAYFARVLDS
jgi:Uma2 family endonuclease